MRRNQNRPRHCQFPSSLALQADVGLLAALVAGPVHRGRLLQHHLAGPDVAVGDHHVAHYVEALDVERAALAADEGSNNHYSSPDLGRWAGFCHLWQENLEKHD